MRSAARPHDLSLFRSALLARLGVALTAGALALPLALSGCAHSSAQEQGNSVEAILGPVDLNDEMGPVVNEPQPEPAPQEELAAAEPEPEPEPVAAVDPAAEGATQAISFDGPDGEAGMADEVKPPPKRPTLPALELFGSGGKGGPG